MTTVSRWAGGVLLAASLLPWAAAASASTQASGDVRINQNQVPTTAASFGSHDCSGFDQSKIGAGLDGFHFVLTGTGYSMTELRAYFDTGTITTTTFVHNGTQAYVYVTHGSTLTDAWADLTPKLAADANVQLVLSGTCVGTGGTTTTPATPCPTTTVTKTVTVPGPTETVTHSATTTVTAPGETTTVTAPGTTTTATTTVTAPPETVTATHTVTATQTVTQTVTATATTTVTQTVQGPTSTVTETVPGPTETITLPGATITVTSPGPTATVTETTTAPGSTVTATVTSSAGTSVLPTKIGQSTTPATAVLGEKVGSLPQTGSGLPVGKALALSLALMIAGVFLLALPGHVGLEINRKH